MFFFCILSICKYLINSYLKNVFYAKDTHPTILYIKNCKCQTIRSLRVHILHILSYFSFCIKLYTDTFSTNYSYELNYITNRGGCVDNLLITLFAYLDVLENQVFKK